MKKFFYINFLIVTGILLTTVFSSAAAFKILPLGDSITDGAYKNQFPGAYRIELWNILKEKGFSIDFVGSKRNGPTTLPDKDYEGWIGMWSDCHKVNKTETSGIDLDATLVKNKPDIVLMLLGTNDIIHGIDDDVAKIPANLIANCEKIWSLLPGIPILVGTLPPISKDTALNLKIKKANELITTQIVRYKSKKGYYATVIDIYGVLDFSKDLKDGIHPNETGYSKIASVWYGGLKAFLTPTLVNAQTQESTFKSLKSNQIPQTYNLSGQALNYTDQPLKRPVFMIRIKGE